MRGRMTRAWTGSAACSRRPEHLGGGTLRAGLSTRSMPGADAIADFGRVLDEAPRWELRSGRTSTRDVGKPVVFSISFGSLLALATAAVRAAITIARLDAVRRLRRLPPDHAVLLVGRHRQRPLPGGARSAEPAGRDDEPAGAPLAEAQAERDECAAGWRRYVEATWGRPEMKARDQLFEAVAEELAPGVPARVRELFLVGIGARPGAEALAYPALERFDATAARSAAVPKARVRCRVDLGARRGRRRHPVRARRTRSRAASSMRTCARTSPACTATPARRGRRCVRIGGRAARRCCAILRALS